MEEMPVTPQKLEKKKIYLVQGNSILRYNQRFNQLFRVLLHNATKKYNSDFQPFSYTTQCVMCGTSFTDAKSWERCTVHKNNSYIDKFPLLSDR